MAATTPRKIFPVNPANPHRICWGCDKYCPANSMACGNGSDRTQHPIELFGDDWMEWQVGQPAPVQVPAHKTEPVQVQPRPQA